MLPNQGIGAEMVAERWHLSRAQLDEYSLASHEKAAAAQDEGGYDEQIVPVTTPGGTVVTKDEGIRRGGTLEAMATLKPAFKPDGVITAGNSSQISDGSAALLITTSEKAAELGLTPLARIHTAVLAAADPVIMLTAPIPATQKALQRSGLTIDQIGAAEINEAFAPVPLAWLAELGADPKVLNPNGGAIALGHPLGGSGARAMTTLVYRMRDHGIRYGLQAMCEGGGQANATILEAAVARGSGACGAPFTSRSTSSSARWYGSSWRARSRRTRRPGRRPGSSTGRCTGRPASTALIGFNVPEEFGGGGVDDFRFNAVVTEELAKAGPGTPAFTPAQRRRGPVPHVAGDAGAAAAVAARLRRRRPDRRDRHDRAGRGQRPGRRPDAGRCWTAAPGCCPGPRRSSPPGSTPTW